MKISFLICAYIMRWAEVTQERKTEKMGWWKGTLAEGRMLKDVLRVTYPPAAISQTWHMHLLRITEEQGSTVEEIM